MLLPILWLLRSSAHSLDAIFCRKIKTRQKFHIHDTVLIASEVTTLIVWGRHRYKFRNISLSVTLSDWLSDWGDNITGCVTWDMTHRPATDMHRGGGGTSGHPWSLASPHHYRHIRDPQNRVQQNTFHTGSTGSSSVFEQSEGFPLNLTDSYFSYAVLMVLLLTNGPVLLFSHFQISPHTCNFVLAMSVNYEPIHSIIACSL